MATCDVDALLAESNCFNNLTPFQLKVIQTQLLANILLELDPAADVSVDALLADAACFNALEPGMLNVIIAQLLCEVVTQ